MDAYNVRSSLSFAVKSLFGFVGEIRHGRCGMGVDAVSHIKNRNAGTNEYNR